MVVLVLGLCGLGDGLLLACGLFFCENFLIAARAEGVFPCKIAVVGADREGGCDRDVGQSEAGKHPLDKIPTGRGARKALVHVEVENGSPGVAPLKFFLMSECLKGIISRTDRKLA